MHAAGSWESRTRWGICRAAGAVGLFSIEGGAYRSIVLPRCQKLMSSAVPQSNGVRGKVIVRAGFESPVVRLLTSDLGFGVVEGNIHAVKLLQWLHVVLNSSSILAGSDSQRRALRHPGR